MTIDLQAIRAALPTIFHGVFWDAGWEYDAPCVMYSPFRVYGIGGNSQKFDSMVEDVCIDLTIPARCGLPQRDWCASTLKEFAWRNWSVLGFSKRKQAWHIEIKVRWYVSAGDLEFKVVKRREQWGPFK